MDSGNLFRLGIFQQLRARGPVPAGIGSRAAPYVTWGVGAVSTATSDAAVDDRRRAGYLGAGVEFEVPRLAHIGLSFTYRPMLLAGWIDTAKLSDRPASRSWSG